MTKTMNAILERLLSQEIRNQEIWQKEEFEKLGIDPSERAAIITEIQTWMKENDIRFNSDWYLRPQS